MLDLMLFHILTILALIQIIRLFHIDMDYRDETERERGHSRIK